MICPADETLPPNFPQLFGVLCGGKSECLRRQTRKKATPPDFLVFSLKKSQPAFLRACLPSGALCGLWPAGLRGTDDLCA